MLGGYLERRENIYSMTYVWPEIYNYINITKIQHIQRTGRLSSARNHLLFLKMLKLEHVELDEFEIANLSPGPRTQSVSLSHYVQ